MPTAPAFSEGAAGPTSGGHGAFWSAGRLSDNQIGGIFGPLTRSAVEVSGVAANGHLAARGVVMSQGEHHARRRSRWSGCRAILASPGSMRASRSAGPTARSAGCPALWCITRWVAVALGGVLQAFREGTRRIGAVVDQHPGHPAADYLRRLRTPGDGWLAEHFAGPAAARSWPMPVARGRVRYRAAP
jgi:hypothetical protein